MSKVPMSLFEPIKFIEKSVCGIDDLILKTVEKVEDDEVKQELLSNIVLSGGGSMFSDIDSTLQSKLKSKTEYKIKVISPPNRQNLTWNGASLMSSMDTFDEKWITKEEYEEYGEDIVNKLTYVF
eukprot:gene5241-8852_t